MTGRKRRPGTPVAVAPDGPVDGWVFVWRHADQPAGADRRRCRECGQRLITAYPGQARHPMCDADLDPINATPAGAARWRGEVLDRRCGITTQPPDPALL